MPNNENAASKFIEIEPNIVIPEFLINEILIETGIR